MTVRARPAAHTVPGRDRRAQRHPGPPGRPDVHHHAAVPRAAVVGGGIAGVAAAVGLAERGVAVTLYEREDDLGGRLRGWSSTMPDGATATMSRGFHAFFRQYYNLRALLRRADPALSMLRPVPDYPLVHRDGTRESFAGLPRSPPWNVLGFVLGSPTFGAADLFRMDVRAATSLFGVRVPDVYRDLDHLDADEFLRRIRFPAAARHLAFEVFSRSFFCHPGSLSAAELVAMFHTYFLGSGEGLLFDVPGEPYPRALWAPLRRYLQGLGAEVRTGVDVRRLGPGGTRAHRVETRVAGSAEAAEYDAVVLAADVTGLRELVERSDTPADPAWRRSVRAQSCAPPFLVSRLWLDRTVSARRPPFLGTSGFGCLDNVSVLERFEGEAARWSEARGGSVLEMHAYALDPGCDRAEVADRLWRQTRSVYPELRAARVVHAEHVLGADCPLFAPGAFARRPGVRTADPTLVLAGDLVRIDLPVALMERAATTGLAAANALLEHWGTRGHDLWSVPNGRRFRAPAPGSATRGGAAPTA